MFLRIVVLALTALLARSAFAERVAQDASWSGTRRWENMPIAPMPPARHVAGTRDLASPHDWRPAQRRAKGASASSSTPAMLPERSRHGVRRAYATPIDGLVRARGASHRALPYDATAPPGA